MILIAGVGLVAFSFVFPGQINQFLEKELSNSLIMNYRQVKILKINRSINHQVKPVTIYFMFFFAFAERTRTCRT